MNLAAYIDQAARTPAKWGSADCCTFPCDWVVARGNLDPMARWRGMYGTAREAMRIIVQCGGLVDMFTLGMIDAQIPEADEPRKGDIGVLVSATPEGLQHVGGIFTGERWARLAEPAGVLIDYAEPVKVWRP